MKKTRRITYALCAILLILVSCSGGETEIISADVQTDFVKPQSQYYNPPHRPQKQQEKKEEVPEKNYSYTLALDPDTREVYCSDSDFVVCIKKPTDTDFIILNLTDIQCLVSSDLNNAKSIISKLISYKKPDLITITGDMTESGIKDLLVGLCDYLNNEIEIPWAPVFGNHDHQGLLISLEDQCKLFESYDLCLFKTGPYLGTTTEPVKLLTNVPKLGNYIINIVEKDSESFKVVKSLYMMNTGSGNFSIGIGKIYNSTMYDNLNSNQLKFYTDSINCVQKYGKNNSVSAAIFVHIPITEYVPAFNAAFKGSNNNISFADSFDDSYWNEGYKDSFGVKHEDSGCSMFNDHVFDTIKGKTTLFLCGHDHLNNFVIKYKGVTLAYSVKSGTGNYHDSSMLGGTFVTIDSTGNETIEHKFITDY